MVFTGSLFWVMVMSSPSIIATPSPGQSDHLLVGARHLRADRVHDRVGHRAVVERSDQPALLRQR